MFQRSGIYPQRVITQKLLSVASQNTDFFYVILASTLPTNMMGEFALSFSVLLDLTEVDCVFIVHLDFHEFSLFFFFCV